MTAFHSLKTFFSIKGTTREQQQLEDIIIEDVQLLHSCIVFALALIAKLQAQEE